MNLVGLPLFLVSNHTKMKSLRNLHLYFLCLVFLDHFNVFGTFNSMSEEIKFHRCTPKFFSYLQRDQANLFGRLE